MNGEPGLTQPLYTSRSRVAKVEGLHRQAVLETGEKAPFGVHGPLAEFYKLPRDVPLPFPVDYIVAATGG